MRRVGQEAAQPVLALLPLAERLLDLGEHCVQRQAETADLCPAVRGAHSLREVARRDRAGGVAHAVERPQPEAHEPPRQASEGEQHAADHEGLDA